MNWHEEFDKLTEKERQEFGEYTSRSLRRLRKSLKRRARAKQEQELGIERTEQCHQ